MKGRNLPVYMLFPRQVEVENIYCYDTEFLVES